MCLKLLKAQPRVCPIRVNGVWHVLCVVRFEFYAITLIVRSIIAGCGTRFLAFLISMGCACIFFKQYIYVYIFIFFFTNFNCILRFVRPFDCFCLTFVLKMLNDVFKCDPDFFERKKGKNFYFFSTLLHFS